jgi:hypothetical protein
MASAGLFIKNPDFAQGDRGKQQAVAQVGTNGRESRAVYRERSGNAGGCEEKDDTRACRSMDSIFLT